MTKEKTILIGIGIVAISLFLAVKALAFTVTYPRWYSTDPSVVAIDQKLGTMKAVWKGTATVCEQFSAIKTQCFVVTIK